MWNGNNDYETEMINPEYIVPINDTEDKKLSKIEESMEREGYLGRPILVLRISCNEYQALTGSHRIQAAKDLLIDVPAVVIEQKEGYDYWDLAQARNDEGRLFELKELVRDGGVSEDAVRLMEEELRDEWEEY